MKKSNSTQKALGAFRKLGAVALITATLAMFFVACNQTGGGGGKPTPTPKPKHAITFGVEGGNGTLKAKVDGGDITSGKEVEEGKTVTFTAEPDAGYRVKEWKVDGDAVNGTNNSYSLKIEKTVNLKVSFDNIPLPTYAITFSVDGANGTLKAKADGVSETATSPITVEEGKTVTFTAEPSANYKVKEWKVGDTVVTGNTSNTYTHTVTQPTTIKVSFELLPAGTAILTLDPNKLSIRVRAVTADGSAIAVEGCTETTLNSGYYTELHAKGTTAILKGYITEFNCSSYEGHRQSLAALDVSGCTSLQKLYCVDNQLTELNVQGCTSLKELVCGWNQFTELNVQGLTALQKLDCYGGKLTSLDVHSLTSLKKLICVANKQLTSLDVSGLTALQELVCRENRLTSLNVQGCTALQKLDCSVNQLPELNVQGCTALRYLECRENKLTKLNVQGLTALKYLKCEGNKLTSLELQGLTVLESLNCIRNKLDAKAMTEILNALPARYTYSGSAKLYTEENYYYEESREHNHKDFSQPAELKEAFGKAKKREWVLLKRNEKGEDEVI